MRQLRLSSRLAFEDSPADLAISGSQALWVEMPQPHFIRREGPWRPLAHCPHESTSLVCMEDSLARDQFRPSEKKMHLPKEANQGSPLCPEYSKCEQGYLTLEEKILLLPFRGLSNSQRPRSKKDMEARQIPHCFRYLSSWSSLNRKNFILQSLIV